MIGNFDGEVYPRQGKYFYSWGSQYAAQTFNNISGKKNPDRLGTIEQPGCHLIR